MSDAFRPQLASILIWHFAGLFGFLAADRAGPEFVCQHGVVGRATAAEFPLPEDVAYVHEQDGKTHKPGYGEKSAEEIHTLVFIIILVAVGQRSGKKSLFAPSMTPSQQVCLTYLDTKLVKNDINAQHPRIFPDS
jgi:hypothetical protein